MCTNWKRCDSHPTLKMQRAAARASKLEKERDAILEEQRMHSILNPETWEGSRKDAVFTTKATELNSRIEDENAKIQRHLNEFYMTSKGKEYLGKRIADVTNSDVERFDAAAEQISAEWRKTRQSRTGRILDNQDIPGGYRLWFADRELSDSYKEIDKYDARSVDLMGELDEVNSKMRTLQASGDEEGVKALEPIRNKILREKLFIEKQKKNVLGYVDRVKSWKVKFLSKGIDSIVAFNEKAIQKFFKYMI